jgi:hypothetical protein
LGGGDLVNEVAIDVEEGGETVIVYDVIVPDFIVEGSWSREEGTAATRSR